jgi:hypothetical protein
MKSNRILAFFLPGSSVFIANIISKCARATDPLHLRGIAFDPNAQAWSNAGRQV